VEGGRRERREPAREREAQGRQERKEGIRILGGRRQEIKRGSGGRQQEAGGRRRGGKREGRGVIRYHS
jgi:hypothetical protein